jgi:hypothetical protein
MTITLTREEVQQVLDALVFATPSGYGPTEVYKNSIVLLQNRLAKETPYEVGQRLYRQGLGISDIPTAVYSDSDIAEAYLGFEAARLNAPEPRPVRLRRGDILRCIETNELCTVWATSTTGKTQVKWKANDFGSYTAEQIGDLFWVEPKPEPEPVAWEYCGALFHDKKEVFAWHERGDIGSTPPKPLYSAPPQQEKREPVAWMNEGDIGKTDWKVWAHGKPTATIPLYTALPQRKPWDNKVLITDEYERGVIDGMQKQMQSSVDKAVNKLAKREWQGLTDEEMSEAYNVNYSIYKEHVEYVDFVLIYRTIEAKLKEKNND